eukprot:m.33708 g.33708  ORF g.33708 m.33708 type:complete len:319 (+) comp14251_c0_seq5:229-1185(+)
MEYESRTRRADPYGQWLPPFAPGITDANADYVPGVWHSANGPVYGMWLANAANPPPMTYQPIPFPNPTMVHPPNLPLPFPAVTTSPFTGAAHTNPAADAAATGNRHAPGTNAALNNGTNDGNGVQHAHGHAHGHIHVQGPDGQQHFLNLVIVPRQAQAGFLRRCTAQLIDFVFISIIALLLGGDGIISALDSIESSGILQTGDSDAIEAEFLRLAENFAVEHLLMYYVVMCAYDVLSTWIFKGASLGKLIMGLRIVGLHDTQRPQWYQFLLRGVLKTVECKSMSIAATGTGLSLTTRLTIPRNACHTKTHTNSSDSYF